MGKIVWLFFGNLLFSMLPWAMAADVTPQNPPTIVIEQELHFTSDEGTDIAVAPDSYTVAPGPEARPAIELRTDTGTIALPASVISHQEDVGSPAALLVPGDPDNLHLVLLLPGRKAFDALGFFDAARPRGINPTVSEGTQITPALFQQATQHKTVSPTVMAELQRLAAEQQRAKAESDPQALLARIKALEWVLSCLYIDGFHGHAPAFPPPPNIGPAETPDVRWNGMKCPGK